MPIQIQPQLYFHGDNYFQAAIAEINKAQTEVLLESYIFDLDPIGLRVLDAISAAKNRGVKVYILVDGVGSFNWLTALEKYCHQHRIHFRAYHPLPFHRRSLKSLSWKNIRRFLLIYRQVNKRLHRKVLLIDRKILFLGSLNISQCHTSEFMGDKAWRDTGVQLSSNDNTAFHIVVHAFFNSWSSTKLARLISAKALTRKVLEAVPTPEKLRNTFQYLLENSIGTSKHRFNSNNFLRLNSKIRWRFLLLRDLRRRLKTAQSRILITNAYFIPRQSLLRNMRRAARRGVYVALCLPAITDVKVVQWASRSLYYRLLKDGVHIFEYQNRVLHAKTLIIDDWATVGSHNLNHRSLNHDLEIEWMTENPKDIKILLQQWDTDIQHCHSINMADLGRWTLWDRAIGRVAYWFRYWI